MSYLNQFSNNGNYSSSGFVQSNLISQEASISGVYSNVANSSSAMTTSVSVSTSENFSSSVSGANFAFSAIENAILKSTIPIDINETEEITVLGERGLWTNKSEIINWNGPIPINQYVINEDPNPEIIRKKVSQQLEYVQELAIRYLRPSTPPVPGDIIIKQEANSYTPPAPPIIIRQQPARPPTPEPLVIREAPPPMPAPVGRKIITISGKKLAPPPRKVIIERLPVIPAKPQSLIIERWLPYPQQKRKVIFQKLEGTDASIMKPRNIIIQWEAPSVSIKKEIKNLGIIKANPTEYISKYGATLKSSNELPQYVLDIQPPQGVLLAANYKFGSVYELEGDVHALKLIDLDREGLSEYKFILQKMGAEFIGSSTVVGTTMVGSSSILTTMQR